MAANDCVNCFDKCKNPNAPEYQKCFKPEHNNGCDCGCGNGEEPTRLLASTEFAQPYDPSTEKTIVRKKLLRSDFV